MRGIAQSDGVATVNVTFGPPLKDATTNASTTPLNLHLRIPSWASNATVAFNGQTWESCNGTGATSLPQNGSFCVVQRYFQPCESLLSIWLPVPELDECTLPSTFTECLH